MAPPLTNWLWGWKEIGSRIGRSPAWCRYWSSDAVQEEIRLPVKKLGTGPKPRVMVAEDDLVQWADRVKTWRGQIAANRS